MTRQPRPLEPVNTQFLRENKFNLSIARLTAVAYFLTAASIPGISIQELAMPTPFRAHRLAGYKIQYQQQFTVTFIVDEDLKNWTELHDWMIGIAPPDSTDQYAANASQYGLNVNNEGQIQSDARLMLYTAQNTFSYEFVFEDMFPTNLGNLEFHMNSAAPITASATFAFSKYRLDAVNVIDD